MKKKIHDIAPEEVQKTIAQWLAGDQLAFASLYELYFPKLAKYIGWLANDMDLGKDVAQEVWVKLHQKPKVFDPSRNFEVWLYAIAKNQWKNNIREHNTLKKYQLNSEFHLNENCVQNNETAKLSKVKSALEKLSEAHREVFVLKYSNGLIIKEIAEIMELSEGTVKSRLFYALQQLRAELNPSKIQEK